MKYISMGFAVVVSLNAFSRGAGRANSTNSRNYLNPTGPYSASKDHKLTNDMRLTKGQAEKFWPFIMPLLTSGRDPEKSGPSRNFSEDDDAYKNRNVSGLKQKRHYPEIQGDFYG